MKQQQHRWSWVPVTWVALRWGDRSCPHRDGRANVGLAPAPRAGLSWWPQAPCAGAASPFPPQRALPASLGGGQHLLPACQETGRWGWDGAPPLHLAGSHEMSLESHTPSSRKVKWVWGKKERHPQKRQNLSVLTQRQGGDVRWLVSSQFKTWGGRRERQERQKGRCPFGVPPWSADLNRHLLGMGCVVWYKELEVPSQIVLLPNLKATKCHLLKISAWGACNSDHS